MGRNLDAEVEAVNQVGCFSVIGFSVGLLLGFVIFCCSAQMSVSHANPLCPRCESEYQRGWGDSLVAFQAELERRGFAEFCPETNEWRPVRIISLEKILKEK